MSRLIRLSPDDNIAAASVTLEPGEELEVDGRRIRVLDRIPTGHKVAILPIGQGEKVLKYGAPIGSARCAIKPGQYVHTHNLQSDYLPTYTLDGGNPYLKD